MTFEWSKFIKFNDITYICYFDYHETKLHIAMFRKETSDDSVLCNPACFWSEEDGWKVDAFPYLGGSQGKKNKISFVDKFYARIVGYLFTSFSLRNSLYLTCSWLLK